MCDLELDTVRFGLEWDVEFEPYFDCREELDAMAVDGLVNLDGAVIRVTETGRLFLRNIAMLFDGYQKQTAITEIAPRYSKTV